MLADQQPLAGDFLIDLGEAFRQRLEFCQEVVAQFRRPLGQVVSQGDLNRGDGRRAGQGIAARGGGMHEGIGFFQRFPNPAVTHETADGHHPAAQGLGRHHDIRFYTPVVHAPQGTGTAKAGLNLIADHQDAEPVANLANPGPVRVRGNDGAGFTLNGLGHETGDRDTHRVANLKLPFQGIGITKGHEEDLGAIGLQGCPECLFTHHAEGSGGFAMEGFHRGDEAVFARVQAGDFKGTLDCFRSAGNEKGMVDVARRDLGQ